MLLSIRVPVIFAFLTYTHIVHIYPHFNTISYCHPGLDPGFSCLLDSWFRRNDKTVFLLQRGEY